MNLCAHEFCMKENDADSCFGSCKSMSGFPTAPGQASWHVWTLLPVTKTQVSDRTMTESAPFNLWWEFLWRQGCSGHGKIFCGAKTGLWGETRICSFQVCGTVWGVKMHTFFFQTSPVTFFCKHQCQTRLPH